MRKYIKECFVKSVLHYDALKVWNQLQVGDDLRMSSDRSPDLQIRVLNAKRHDQVVNLNAVDVKVLHNFNRELKPQAIKLFITKKWPKDGTEALIDKDFCIGELSIDDGSLIADIIAQGHDIFEASISLMDDKAEEDRKIKVVIYIKEN